MGSVRPPRIAVNPGERVAHFVVVEKIGEGGMGIVYKANDEQLRRTVALKVLPPEYVGDAERKRRFVREARAAAAITHPNIAAVYEVGDAAGMTYIAMELIAGSTLRDHIARRLQVREAMRIATAVARALTKAHAKGIVHRDLKPDNVMISEDGEVKVLDFGLAKLDTRSLIEEQDTVTMEGRVMGTFGYMSPEQATAAEVDGRTDVFALGVMLFEMLTGERPFHGKRPLDVLVALSTTGPPAASAQNPDVPPELDQLITRCLQKEPADRLAADEVRMALDAMLAVDSPVAAASSRRLMQGKDSRPSGIGSTVLSGDDTARPARLWPVAAAIGLVAAAGAVVWTATRPAAPLAGDAGSAVAVVADDGGSARAAFERGRRRMWKGQWRGGCQEVAQASDREPAFASAAFLVAFCRSRVNANSGRPYYDRATRGRADLAAPEAAVLDALEAVYRRYPVDWDEYRRKLEGASKRFPASSLVRFADANASAPESFEQAIVGLDAVIALDADFARPLSLKAEYLTYEGKLDDARAVTGTCLERFPDATDCLAEKNELDRFRGDAHAMEVDARRAMMTNPDEPRFYDTLANAMLTGGATVATLEEILRQKRSHWPVETRPQEELADGIRCALIAGDFERAERDARVLDEGLANDARMRVHAWPALVRVQALREMDRAKDAVPVARAFLAKRDAWEPDLKADDWAMASDPTASMLSVLLEAGAIERPELERERAAWIGRWEDRAELTSKRFLWFHAWAAGATTPELASAALDARPRYEPLPLHALETIAPAAVGHVDLLAGRTEEAVAALREATASVSGFAFPVEHTRAFFDLGQALERTNDPKQACAAYGHVLARWRDAQPRSVTADAARKRIAALRCPP
jgi:eukaryotic-like serine/threonine-protein kinase